MNIIKKNLVKFNSLNNTENITNMKHFPSSTREWNNSIYLYYKNNLNLVPVASVSSKNVIKSYFSLYFINIEKKLRAKNMRNRRKLLSKNKIFISNNEFKHTNNKVIINIYTFNRQEKNYFSHLKKVYINFFSNEKKNSYKLNNKKHINKFNKKYINKSKKNIYLKRINYIFNKLSYISQEHKKNIFIKTLLIKYFPKIIIIFLQKYKLKFSLLRYKNKKLKKSFNFKQKFNLSLFLFKKLNILQLSNLSLKEIYDKLELNLIKLKKNIKKKWLKKLKIYFFYRQLIFINKYKFNFTYLQYLTEYLEPIYNKQIEFNIINLKRFYLNSDILYESLKLKINKNRRNISKYLNNLKKKINIKNKSSIKLNNFNLFKKRYFYKKLNSLSLQKKVIENIKHKYIIGFRIEAKGRLSKRHTASRSITNVKYSGSLLNLDSSYKGLSTVLLKGNLESSLQCTKIRSKTRIGSYGIKGWINSY